MENIKALAWWDSIEYDEKCVLLDRYATAKIDWSSVNPELFDCIKTDTIIDIWRQENTKELALAWWNSLSNYIHESEDNSKEYYFNDFGYRGSANFYNELNNEDIIDIWRGVNFDLIEDTSKEYIQGKGQPAIWVPKELNTLKGEFNVMADKALELNSKLGEI